MGEQNVYNEDTIGAMGEWIALHRRLGEVRAKKNWVACCDPDGRKGRHRALMGWEKALLRKIEVFKASLLTILDDAELKILKDECMSECENVMYECEMTIEKEYRPTDLIMNKRAIVMRTTEIIPDDILLGLSFGWKFLFPYMTTDDNIHSVLAQMDHCIEGSVPEVFQEETFKKIGHILAKRTRVQHDNTVQWLRFIALRSKRFFTQNKGIFATRSDKGGHTVIVDQDEYERTLNTMLSDSNYMRLDRSPLRSLVMSEYKLIKFCNNNKKIRAINEMRKFRLCLEPHTLSLAKFYGLPKIHKDIFCLRPILAMNGAPGFAAGKIFDMMLNRIFHRSDLHLKDSFETKRFLDTVRIRECDRLVSFDVVSMFTSIPIELATKLIMEKSNEFGTEFNLGRGVLSEFINLLLGDCTVFTALDAIYKQREGLPMGSCISPTLARIVMDNIIGSVLEKVPEISFIKVFVDDTIAAINGECIGKTLDALNNFDDRIKFTCELEGANQEINFLNLTLIREGPTILTNWFRKGFASGRLVNFFSSHKRTTVIETTKNFIRTVISLSDGKFFKRNRDVVIDTLRDNNFPETLIMTLMNECYTLMRGKKPSTDEAIAYSVYPHAVCESRKIKRVMYAMKHRNITLAESTRNTKINLVTTRKTPTPLLKRGNMVISAKCNCGQKYKCTQTKWGENAQMAIRRRMFTLHKKCQGGIHAFRKYYLHKGLAYRSQTDYLARYIQWKFKGKYLNNDVGRPQHHFVKLLNSKRLTGVKICF